MVIHIDSNGPTDTTPHYAILWITGSNTPDEPFDFHFLIDWNQPFTTSDRQNW